MSQDLEPLELSRADRQPSAYVGFEELTARHFYIRLDDRILYQDRYTDYDRQAIDRRTGVRYR